ncbi:MAG: metallophosphoesterase family protein [bacterium]|nr:metallophosphoesterase family protein [bacterium]
MRILILSDIHGNIFPLEKVLKSESYDLMICLGDLVDYGPFPDEVISIVREKANYCVMGNHDYSYAFDVDCPGTTEEFKKITYKVRDYFKYNLSSENAEFLKALPLTQEVVIDKQSLLLYHSSAKDPLGDYVTFSQDQETIKEKMLPNKLVDIVLYGHTHQSGKLQIGNITIFNPGSLGFPRGKDRYPTYGILENGYFEIKRVEYDVSKIIKEYKRHSVPEEIIHKLMGVTK